MKKYKPYEILTGIAAGFLMLLIVTLVLAIFTTGCRKPTAPKEECQGIFVNGECEEEEPEEISQETINRLFATGMNTPLEKQ